MKWGPDGVVRAPAACSVGAREAAVEDAAIAALLLITAGAVTAEERAPLFVTPMRLGLLGCLAHDHLVVDAVDPARRDLMMAPAGVGIALGQQDAIAADLVDRADMFAVRADHVHMLGDALQARSLRLPFVAPAAEFVRETLLILSAIFVIIAIKIGRAHV